MVKKARPGAAHRYFLIAVKTEKKGLQPFLCIVQVQKNGVRDHAQTSCSSIPQGNAFAPGIRAAHQAARRFKDG